MLKDIPGYEGLYKIDECGNVLSLYKNEYKIPQISKDGYWTVQLWKNGKAKRFKVHRLVAITFIPNPNNYPIVMHKDNNKLNPHYTNLQWGTLSDNSQQAYADGLMHYPETAKPKTVYELYNGDVIYRVLGYRELQQVIQYTRYSTLSTIYRGSMLINGPYKGFRVRKSESDIFKPFTVKPFTIGEAS